MMVAVARDVYGEHYDDLSAEKKRRVIDFAAIHALDIEHARKLGEGEDESE